MQMPVSLAAVLLRTRIGRELSSGLINPVLLHVQLLVLSLGISSWPLRHAPRKDGKLSSMHEHQKSVLMQLVKTRFEH
jgi:hypothetical protein